MSATLDLFSAIEARDRGMELAASGRTDLIDRVRYHLAQVARSRPDRCVTIDDCAALLESEGMSLGNAAGTVFKHEAWEFTNRWQPSSRKSSHARHVRVWMLKEGRS